MDKKKARSKLWRAYTKSSINFSTITGLRYPGIPRLKGNFLYGRLRHMFQEDGLLNDTIAASKLAEQHPSGMCYFWLGTQLVLVITHSDDIHELKVKCANNISTDLPLLEKFAGPSLFTDNRETWQKKRQVCLHATSLNELKKIEPGMVRVVNHYIQQLDGKLGQPVELRTLFNNLVVDMVSSNLLGCSGKAFDEEIAQRKIDQPSALSQYLASLTNDVLEYRNLFKWMLPGFIRKIFFRNELNDFGELRKKSRNQYEKAFLNPHKADILAGENLLKQIWQINHGKNTDKSEYNSEEIFSDGTFLLSAGVATTVATLEFIIKLLAAHPAQAQKLHTEINNHLGNDDITLTAVNQIAYLDMVVNETMRLFAPAPFLIPRTIATYTEINGVPLFKGDFPIIPAYSIHRSAKLWNQPDSFIPERFAEENVGKIPKYAYMPFSIGPRFCAGQQFALQEMKLVIASLYRNYQIKVENNSFDITLKQGGLSPKVPPIATFSRYHQGL